MAAGVTFFTRPGIFNGPGDRPEKKRINEIKEIEPAPFTGVFGT